MTRVQVIEKDVKPDFYVVQADLWGRLKGGVEDAEDSAAYAEAGAEAVVVAWDDGVCCPAAVARAIATGATQEQRHCAPGAIFRG